MSNGDEPISTGQRLVPAHLLDPLTEAISHTGRAPPVFLHASFRTGSTWLWLKLRSAPTTLAYYEIFHEILATLTVAEAKGIEFSSWDSRHPPSTPYFLEFMPLLEAAGGIAEFVAGTAFGTFMPGGGPDGGLTASETMYVERLISAAWLKKRIPVLACTRSLGRARALRRAVGGRSILLHRNLFHQWASYCCQAEAGNDYFLDTIRWTVDSSGHDPFLRSVSAWFDLGAPSRPREELFEVFLILHLYLYGTAFDAADLVVDLTDIANDRSHRRHVEREISGMIQHDIDLSDVREDCEFTGLVVDRPAKVRDTIEQFAKLIPAATISMDGLRFIEQARDRALAEWDRFEFFNRRARSVWTKTFETTEARLEAAAAETENLRAERDRLAADLSAAVHVREAEQVSHDAWVGALTTQRDTFHAALAAAGSERDALGHRLSQIEAERDALQAALLAAGSERDALGQRLSQTEADRDAAETRLTGLAAACEVAIQKEAATAAERDALREQLAAASVVRDELERSLAGLMAAREASLYLRARKLMRRRA